MGRVQDKVAFITGAGHGQGRSHALRLAQEGADIIAVDYCTPFSTVPYEMATSSDLAETARLVKEEGRRVVTVEADVRDFKQLNAALDEGIAQFGRLDIVAANAGIVSYGASQDITEQAWNDVIDTNLKGVWHTCKAAIPHLIEGGRGGSVVLTSSVAGIKGYLNQSHYVASKHGVVGLMRALANELSPHSIRVNSVHPTAVPSNMLINNFTYKLFRPEMEAPTLEDAKELFYQLNGLPIPWVEAVDISNAVLFLASDESRYITGVMLQVDAGATTK